MTVSKSVSTLGQPTASLANGGYLLILHLYQRACSPAATLRHGLLVGSEVEDNEEDEVRCEDADAGDGGELLAGAPAGIGEPGPVGAGEVCPGSEINESYSYR